MALRHEASESLAIDERLPLESYIDVIAEDM